MSKTIEEIRNETDANVYIDRAIAMLKEKCEGEYLVAGYNGIVSLLGYAKESHQFQQEQKQDAVVPAHSGDELWDEVQNIIDYYRVWGDDSTAKQQLKLKFSITKK